MKKMLLCLLFLCVSMYGVTQTSKDSMPSVLNPEKKAEFKGGVNGWVNFLQSKINPSLLSAAGAPVGAYRTLANFLIDSLGQVSDIRIEVDPGFGAAEELVRILKLSSKKWIPAYDQGRPVPYRQKQSLTLLSN